MREPARLRPKQPLRRTGEIDIVRDFAGRRRRSRWLILLSLPVAFGGFLAGVLLEPRVGLERAGLLMGAGMLGAFILFGLALHTIRCPACHRIQIYKRAGRRWRAVLSPPRCIHCDVNLQD